MYKDLLVPITTTPADDAALELALQLAAHAQAHVTVLEVVNLPFPATPWGMSPELAMADLYRRLRSEGEDSVLRLRQRLAGEEVSTEVLLVETMFVEAPSMAVRWAQTHAISVVGNVPGDSSNAERTRAMIGSLMLESGRPVLSVPERVKATVPPRNIAIAWKPTTQAARALIDAMPLLQSAEKVELVMIDPIEEESAAEHEPGQGVLAHLRRHGVRAEPVVLHAGRNPDSSALLDHIHQSGAQLLVAGGYGHSRLRQWALEGMTRELLFTARIPVLFSH